MGPCQVAAESYQRTARCERVGQMSRRTAFGHDGRQPDLNFSPIIYHLIENILYIGVFLVYFSSIFLAFCKHSSACFFLKKIIYISVPSLTLGKHNLTDFSIHKQTHYSVSKFIFYLGEKVKESQKNC